MASISAMATPRAYLRSMTAVTASFTVGDLACQRIENKPEFEPRRTARFAFVGGAILGPASHTLELLLERTFPGASVRPIAQKVLCRIAVAPVFLSLNFGTLAVLKGEDVFAALHSKVLPAWQTGSLFWPLVAAVTYPYVPLLARPATGAAVGTVWGAFLSWVAHCDLEPQKTRAELKST